MAKLKILNLKKVQTSLRKQITKELRSKEIRTGVAEIRIVLVFHFGSLI
jgi:hypothetical protein